MTMTSIYPNWVCNSNGFLGLIIDPVTEIGAGFKANKFAGTQTLPESRSSIASTSAILQKNTPATKCCSL